MQFTRSTKQLALLLFLNAFMELCHILNGYSNVFYFCQLTMIAQTLVTINFALSLIYHERKSSLRVKLFLSRLHLVTIALEGIVLVGFWGLRIFFAKGILREGYERNFIDQFLSLYVHGGSFLTMLYFIKTDQIIMEAKRAKKFIFHLCWGIPYLFVQYIHWAYNSTHVYGFLKYFDWFQLIFFQVFLYLLAVAFDYSLTIRHGYKLSVKELVANQHITIQDLQRKKAEQEAQDQRKQESQVSERKKSL